MINNLILHINRFTTLNPIEVEILSDCFELIKLNKKEILHASGKIATLKYFVSKGCLRSYFINNKGVEQILQFAIENWWIADYESLERKLPSTLFIDAVRIAKFLYYQRTEKKSFMIKCQNSNDTLDKY